MEIVTYIKMVNVIYFFFFFFFLIYHINLIYIYISITGRVLYSATPKSDTYILPHPLPSRATPSSTTLSPSLQLLTGKEKIIAAKKATINKRRQSIITITAAPTDLSKIFCKSKCKLIIFFYY
jgi:hypothetical protein